MKIKNKLDDAEIYEALLAHGDDYLPDVIIDNGHLVTGYADVEIDKGNVTDTQISGSCIIEAQDEGDNEDYCYNADYTITIDESGTVEDIEFTNVRMDWEDEEE